MERQNLVANEAVENEKTDFNKMMDAAEKEAERTKEEDSSFTYKFKKPFEFEGKTYEELHFDLDMLTGRDAQAIFTEARIKGRNTMPNIVWADAYYCLLFAVKSCKEKIGEDAFLAMPVMAHNTIVSRVSSFLMREAL